MSQHVLRRYACKQFFQGISLTTTNWFNDNSAIFLADINSLIKGKVNRLKNGSRNSHSRAVSPFFDDTIHLAYSVCDESVCTAVDHLSYNCILSHFRNRAE